MKILTLIFLSMSIFANLDCGEDCRIKLIKDATRNVTSYLSDTSNYETAIKILQRVEIKKDEYCLDLDPASDHMFKFNSKEFKLYVCKDFFERAPSPEDNYRYEIALHHLEMQLIEDIKEQVIYVEDNDMDKIYPSLRPFDQ